MKNVIKSAVLLFTLVFGVFSAYSQTASLSQYELGSGDRVKITVFGQSDLTLETRLSNVGAINYPFLGDIVLIGLSVNEVEKKIHDGLKGDYLVNPSVSVTIIEYRPFFIDGEVKKPGGYPYQPGLSINKAAALAGGYTDRASREQVLIVRSLGGEEIKIEANVSDTVFPGDIVTVQQRYF